MVISGTYAGTVAITEPVHLGVLDIAFDLADNGGTFTGQINNERTLAYGSAPTLSGNLTGSIGGITPTFTIDSAVFEETVSNRNIQRQINLTGEVLDSGATLKGLYTEVITGFTPKPLLMRGNFLVVRPVLAAESRRVTALLVTVQPTSVLPNGTVAVSATLLDNNMQPITQTTSITFTTTLGTVSPVAATTDSDGVVQTTFTAGNDFGVALINATTDNFRGTAAVVITNTAYYTHSLGSEDDTLPTRDGRTMVIATVRNGLRQPIAGKTVSFTGTLGTLSSLSAVTNVEGVAATTFTTGAMPGQATIVAICEGQSQSINVNLETPKVTTLILESGRDQISPGEQASLTITIRDQFDRPVKGEAISLVGPLGTVTPVNGLSDDNGQVTAQFTAGDVPGQATITALSGDVSGSITVTISEG